AGAAGPALSPDSALALTRAYASALETGDTSALGTLRPRLATVVAADTIDRLGARIDATDQRVATLDERGDSLESELETLREEGPGLRPLLRAFADDLGIGFGWSGLYFTAFLALWRGATPGKRLLRLRVLRLDGRPIRWFAAFERFGGYSAGIATGLLGFAQIFWDRNRQGIHDKIAETVVVVE
ncbi:MAG: RDD family protein, partial [Longimicrobiales bacterium]